MCGFSTRPPRAIVVERVVAVFGKASYGRSCNNNGNATQRNATVVSRVRGTHGHPHNTFQQIAPGGGAPFEGSANLDVVFAGKRCPLAVAKLHSPQDRVTYTVFTDDGSQWRLTSTLFYQPRAQIEGGGAGLPCVPGLFPFSC
jgi:hypothetical protein